MAPSVIIDLLEELAGDWDDDAGVWGLGVSGHGGECAPGPTSRKYDGGVGYAGGIAVSSTGR